MVHHVYTTTIMSRLSLKYNTELILYPLEGLGLLPWLCMTGAEKDHATLCLVLIFVSSYD